MNLMTELLGLDEAKKKPKCTCDVDEATCKVHAKKLDESEEFEGSAEFTEAWLDAQSAFKKAFDIINDPKFEQWMKTTDDNMGTDCQSAFSEIMGGMKDASEGWESLERELDQADNA